MPSPVYTLTNGPTLRTALAVTLVTTASLGAQSQPEPHRLSQADHAWGFPATEDLSLPCPLDDVQQVVVARRETRETSGREAPRMTLTAMPIRHGGEGSHAEGQSVSRRLEEPEDAAGRLPACRRDDDAGRLARRDGRRVQGVR